MHQSLQPQYRVLQNFRYVHAVHQLDFNVLPFE